MTRVESNNDAHCVSPSCRLAIKAIPNAPRDSVEGWFGESLKVNVHAPAMAGKANEALCILRARELRLPKRAVKLIRGAKSRLKVMQIEGITAAEVRERISTPC